MKPEKPASSRPEIPPPTREQIVARAHRLWIEAGRPAGRDDQHWAEAERQLRGGAAPEKSTMKTIHIAEMIADGGRDGKVESPDGGLALDLSSDENPGSITPEHLFAGAYASCFLGALKNAAEKAHVSVTGVTVLGRAHLEEDNQGGYQLAIELRASLPGLNRTHAQHLLNLAHQTCPYSKATRGNINVTLGFD